MPGVWSGLGCVCGMELVWVCWVGAGFEKEGWNTAHYAVAAIKDACSTPD